MIEPENKSMADEDSRGRSARRTVVVLILVAAFVAVTILTIRHDLLAILLVAGVVVPLDIWVIVIAYREPTGYYRSGVIDAAHSRRRRALALVFVLQWIASLLLIIYSLWVPHWSLLVGTGLLLVTGLIIWRVSLGRE